MNEHLAKGETSQRELIKPTCSKAEKTCRNVAAAIPQGGENANIKWAHLALRLRRSQGCSLMHTQPSQTRAQQTDDTL